ncbi:SAV_6107 family HEPN domain-containing protein [Ornithinimicrobium sp. Y1847]|uniref:SAV_6107 family HEPN domain-containing protein n=1 Tax=unclassified Ornithinimicrobium TaxID=2615080 RepID=UPI003B68389D
MSTQAMSTREMSTMEADSGTEGPMGSGPVGTVLDLLERSRGGLLLACHSNSAGERYTLAHLSALRAAAALLAARSAPSRRARPRSVWEMLPVVAPELTEWAVFFAESGRRRLALERGADLVSARDADDLVRSGERFLELVRGALHLPCGTPLPAELAPVGR